MISTPFITQWRINAPWLDDGHVEQDLVLSRAIVEIYSSPLLAEKIIFRGGTALTKLYFAENAYRYSEDLDFVQKVAEPIGETLNELRRILDPWLGDPSYKLGKGRATLNYKFETTAEPVARRKIKIEINTREHFSILPLVKIPFSVESEWFSGKADVSTYAIEELLGTKLRALYQRKKGRDLFDMARGLEYLKPDCQKIIDIFLEYLKAENTSVSRAEFEQNLFNKLKQPEFLYDIAGLLSPEAKSHSHLADDIKQVYRTFIEPLPGEPWKKGFDMEWVGENYGN